jgi:hypothetical protein
MKHLKKLKSVRLVQSKLSACTFSHFLRETVQERQSFMRGASSQVKVPSHSQPEPADTSSTREQECQEPSKEDALPEVLSLSLLDRGRQALQLHRVEETLQR